MPPALLFDISKIDLERKPIYDRDAIVEVNPQNYEMQQLDAILWYDKEKKLILGYKDVTENEFWVRGHIPGRPIMPGVIMIECAAQLLSFFVRKILELDAFIGFASIEDAKFRLTVEPGSRLYLLGHLTAVKSRKYSAYIQGVCNGQMIFETTVSGMKV
ncbi:MAG: beta-hydroxyacyl-ACP dehydratase [Phycisphaerae bacterium]|nr:beta-hydroxyacyl-ACP dehydratase [Phycisphaerae bacterium]